MQVHGWQLSQRQVYVRRLCYEYLFSFILKLELITIRKVLHLNSLWKENWGKVGNGLFMFCEQLNPYPPYPQKKNKYVKGARFVHHVIPSLIWREGLWVSCYFVQDCSPNETKSENCSSQDENTWVKPYLPTTALNVEKGFQCTTIKGLYGALSTLGWGVHSKLVRWNSRGTVSLGDTDFQPVCDISCQCILLDYNTRKTELSFSHVSCQSYCPFLVVTWMKGRQQPYIPCALARIPNTRGC